MEDGSFRLETEREMYRMFGTNRDCPAWVIGLSGRTALLAPRRLDIKFPAITAMPVAPLATKLMHWRYILIVKDESDLGVTVAWSPTMLLKTLIHFSVFALVSTSQVFWKRQGESTRRPCSHNTAINPHLRTLRHQARWPLHLC